MLKNVSNTFIDACNSISITLTEYVVLNGVSIPVKAILRDDCYENGNFIGSFIFKTITFEVDNQYDFKNKEFVYHKVVNGEDVVLGTFITTEVEDSDTNQIMKVIGMDYGLKTQVEYSSSLDYSSGTVTLLDVWNECCTMSGLESGISSFTNSNFIVDSDQFTGTGATIRDVFKAIALSSSDFVKVMNDDKIYLVFNEYTSEKKEVEIDGSENLEDVLELDALEFKGNTTQEGTPTPDTPVEVETVTGNQEIVVCGKNLYDATTQEQTTSGVTNSADNQCLYINGTRTSNSGFNFKRTFLKAGTYKIMLEKVSGTIETTSSGALFYVYSPTNEVLTRRPNYIALTNTNYKASMTLTLTEDAEVYIHNWQRTTETFNNTIIKYQIVKGNEDDYEFEAYNGTTYEINLGNIELCKIGDYQDRIYKDSGKWYIEKKIGKLVLDGSESWGRDGLYNGIAQFALDLGNVWYQNDGVNRTLSNRFKGVPYRNSWEIDGSATSSYSNKIRLMTSLYTSVADFKTWLSTHNTTVYYVLATPTTTEITDTSLINQLESIKLLEGINNISINGDLSGILKLSYYDDNFDIIEDYTELEDKRDTHPITCVRLGMSNIQGENIDLKDDELVEEYGENWLVINDNPFAYSLAKRQELITDILDKVKGFGYSSFMTKTSFKPYLTCGDIVQFRNRSGNLVNTIILRYEQDYDEIMLSAPSEISATVNWVRPSSAIDVVKRTEIIVDRDKVRIDSLTAQTQTIQDNLNNNYYTIDQANVLVQTAQAGLTNTFSEAGGNNIFRNTGLWFENSGEDAQINPYEFWNGVVVRTSEDKASNSNGMLLQNTTLSQEQIVPNGTYTVSFKYKVLIPTTVASVEINDVSYSLEASEDTEFIQVIETTSQHIKLEFICETNGGCEIYDLMVNAGGVKLAYSQNQNETTTDTVNISKGITITSSDTDTTFKANADGIRTLDNSGNELTVFTDRGTRTKELIVENQATICNTLIQDINGQTWFTRL